MYTLSNSVKKLKVEPLYIDIILTYVCYNEIKMKVTCIYRIYSTAINNFVFIIFLLSCICSLDWT